MRKAIALIILPLACCSGCWVAAAGAGAEAGYVASQSERSAGETIDDQVLVTRVKTKLLADAQVSGMAINVDSYKGMVTLKGFVKSHHEADRAIELAKEVNGVKSVKSRLIVE